VGAGRPAGNLRGQLAHGRMRESRQAGRAKALLPGNSHRGELRGETHPARATLTRAPGGIILGRVEGELDADFTALGNSARFSASRIRQSLL
jgi:hypothetical protein